MGHVAKCMNYMGNDEINVGKCWGDVGSFGNLLGMMLEIDGVVWGNVGICWELWDKCGNCMGNCWLMWEIGGND